MFYDIAALHCFVEWDKSKGMCRSWTGPGTLCRLPNCWRNTKWETGTTMSNTVWNTMWNTMWNHNVRCSCFPGWRFPMISLWPGKRQHSFKLSGHSTFGQMDGEGETQIRFSRCISRKGKMTEGFRWGAAFRTWRSWRKRLSWRGALWGDLQLVSNQRFLRWKHWAADI